MPIYGQIQSFEITNVLVVVVRYFGGVKLGVGGLISAYKTSAQLTLNEANIIEKTIDKKFKITFDYKNMNKVMRIIKEKNIQNIEIHCSCNGYAAYDDVDVEYLKQRLISFLPSIKFHLTDGDFFPFLKKLNAHYHIMSENDYKIANQILT